MSLQDSLLNDTITNDPSAADITGAFYYGQVDVQPHFDEELLELERMYVPGASPSKLRRRRWDYLWDKTDYIWKPHQLSEWRKRLTCANDETIKKTFMATTQLAPSLKHENEEFPKDYHVPRFPMLNCRRLKEAVYVDVIYLGDKLKKEIPAILFCGGNSKLQALYSLKANPTAVNTLERAYAFVRDYGAPTHFITDSASNLSLAEKWSRFCRLIVTHLRSTEAWKQQQNLVERVWQDLQKRGQAYQQRYLIPNNRLVHLYQHLVDVHNHTALASLNWRTPLEAVTGDTPDISMFRYYFWEPVWYLERQATGRHKNWIKGRFLGIAWNTGDIMCYYVCPELPARHKPKANNRAVCRSLVVPRHPDENGPRAILKHPSDYFWPTPKVSPTNPPQSEGRRKRKRSAQAQDADVQPDEELDESDEDTLMDNIPDVEPGPEESQIRKEYLEAAEEYEKRVASLATPPENLEDWEMVEKIVNHRVGKSGKCEDISFTVSKRDGTLDKVTLEDLKLDCPRLLASYIVKKKDLRKMDQLSEYAKDVIDSSDRISQLAKAASRRFGLLLDPIIRGAGGTPVTAPNQVNIRRVKTAKSNSPNKRKSNPMGKHKYGVYVPRTVDEALEIDKKEGNNLWKEAIKKEIDALQQMGTFKVVKQDGQADLKVDHQYAPLRMIFDVKQVSKYGSDTALHYTDSNQANVWSRTYVVKHD
jgi:hypothetical protein